MKMDPQSISTGDKPVYRLSLGGMGSGMFCLEGGGALSHFSLFHRPDLWNEPGDFCRAFLPTGQENAGPSFWRAPSPTGRCSASGRAAGAPPGKKRTSPV